MAGRLSGRRQDQWKTTELNDETVTNTSYNQYVIPSQYHQDTKAQ